MNVPDFPLLIDSDITPSEIRGSVFAQGKSRPKKEQDIQKT
jgi:hypothetical protein